MHALYRVVVSLVGVAVIGCQAAYVDQSEVEQDTTTTCHVLCTQKWKAQQNWPVSSLMLGTTSYTQPQLRSILSAPIHGNGLIALAQELIAAKLNYAMGASAPDFVSAIAAADAMIGSRVVPPIGTGSLSTSLTNSLAAKLGA